MMKRLEPYSIWSNTVAAQVFDKTRGSLRMTALLQAYFPQVLPWFDDIRTTLVCDFLLLWPT